MIQYILTISLLIMSVVNWGMLTKNVDDNETIEQAIDRIVGEHNDNEDAHLGTGQSLQSHKASEIIDHLARSVYQDKFAYDRFLIKTNWETIDAWYHDTLTNIHSPGFLELDAGAVNSFHGYLLASGGELWEYSAYTSRHPYFLTNLLTYDNTHQTFYFGMIGEEHDSGFGFKIVDSSLYAVYYTTGNVEHTSLISGVTITNLHRYSCNIDADENLNFYVDDVLKYTILPSGLLDPGLFASFILLTSTPYSRYVFIRDMVFESDY